jgi:hypothetical protein
LGAGVGLALEADEAAAIVTFFFFDVGVLSGIDDGVVAFRLVGDGVQRK